MNLEYARSFKFGVVIFCSVLSSSICLAEEKKSKSSSVMELESYIVGDKEQPAISYFVPWKGSKTPDNLEWNVEEKNDKTLEPIDREVMLRSLEIYDQLNLESMPN